MVDVDLSRYFDTIRHDRILAKVAGRVVDSDVLADTPKGRQWADRALERIRREAEAIGVSLNAGKTHLVTITEPGASFAFLGFEFRWERSSKTGTWYSSRTPRSKKVIAVLVE